MKLKALLTLIACSMFAVACGNGKGSSSEVAGAIQQQAGDLTEMSPSGETTGKSDVSAVDVAYVDMQGATEDQKAEVLSQHPDLARDITTLRSIDHVFETSAGKLDLYAGESLMVILAQGQAGWAVESSATTFTPVAIENVMSGEGEQQFLSALKFTLQSCTVEESKQQQEQGKQQQEQGKQQQEQGKQQQEQGKQQQEQGKETCASVVVTLTLSPVQEESKQEQEQGKEQQEQGKDQAEQGKNQGQQEQGKDQAEQGKNQGQQEQGKNQEDNGKKPDDGQA